MKRSLQAVLAVLVAVAGFGLAAAPSGAAPVPGPKAFTITSAPPTAVWSQTVKLTASITPKGGGTPKGGTMTFLADGVPVGTAIATTRNTTLTTSVLPPGEHAITAQYSGDDVIAPATTTTGATVVVDPAPTGVTLNVGPNPVPYVDRAEIKAVVKAVAPAVPTRRPSGTVTFTTDTCISATVAVNSNGVATWRPYLCPGTHTVTATYNGSDLHAGGSQAAATITVEDPDGGGEDEENLDEVNDGDPSAFLVVSDDSVTSSAYAQTITPSRTGRIYAVDLFGAPIPAEGDTPPGPLLISIQTLDDEGNPTGSVLGQAEVDPSEVPGFGGPFHVDLDTQADVEGGVTYGLVLEVAPQAPDAFGAWILAATTADDHPGSLVERIDGAPWDAYDDPDSDLYFRTHLGDPV